MGLFVLLYHDYLKPLFVQFLKGKLLPGVLNFS